MDPERERLPDSKPMLDANVMDAGEAAGRTLERVVVRSGVTFESLMRFASGPARRQFPSVSVALPAYRCSRCAFADGISENSNSSPHWATFFEPIQTAAVLRTLRAPIASL